MNRKKKRKGFYFFLFSNLNGFDCWRFFWATCPAWIAVNQLNLIRTFFFRCVCVFVFFLPNCIVCACAVTGRAAGYSRSTQCINNSCIFRWWQNRKISCYTICGNVHAVCTGMFEPNGQWRKNEKKTHTQNWFWHAVFKSQGLRKP